MSLNKKPIIDVVLNHFLKVELRPNMFIRYEIKQAIFDNGGIAIGTFLCGIMYSIGLRYMFGLSALFTLAQLTLAYILIHQRKTLNIK